MKNIKYSVLALAGALLLSGSMVLATPPDSSSQTGSPALVQLVHRELANLPYYGVFDNLAYQVNGTTVTLYGQVVRPVTKADAESRVKHIEGVTKVVDNIEVLPLSAMDNAIRARVYRAVFSRASMYRYAMGVNPGIHIIVDNGHVTLEGVVSSKQDSELAQIAANGVSGVFSVTNHLRIE